MSGRFPGKTKMKRARPTISRWSMCGAGRTPSSIEGNSPRTKCIGHSRQKDMRANRRKTTRMAAKINALEPGFDARSRIEGVATCIGDEIEAEHREHHG